MFTQKYIKIFQSVQEIGSFSLLKNLALGKASTDDKCLLQFLGLDLFNINLSAKFYPTIPNGLRVKFHFSVFEPRQNLDQSQMSFDNLMGYILSIPMCMQKFITIFHLVLEIGPFSLFQNLELGKTSNDEK